MSLDDLNREQKRLLKRQGALDEKGAPGTAMLGSYVQKLKDAGQTPVRDWAAKSN